MFLVWFRNVSNRRWLCWTINLVVAFAVGFSLLRRIQDAATPLDPALALPPISAPDDSDYSLEPVIAASLFGQTTFSETILDTPQALYSEAEQTNGPVRSQRDASKADPTSMDWLSASEDPLFLRKRAETLGKLLDAKRTFQSLNWTAGGHTLLNALLEHPNGLRTLSTALTEVRKNGLASQVADVSVCGAVPPYNHLLGGKLVALLMTSQEVRDAYRNRYSGQVSIISSQMAGRAIYRPAELKVLTTTSLYGNGSSQYNRLHLRASDFPELEHDIAWRELAKTAGYGTVHLGSTTVRALREISERLYRARRINHRFGEGASPRLRQIREAVEALGINSSAVLHHATPRIFYGCELHPGAIEELIGSNPATENRGTPIKVIAHLWRLRWLSKRIQNDDVLQRVTAENAQTIQQFFNNKRRRETGGDEESTDTETDARTAP